MFSGVKWSVNKSKGCPPSLSAERYFSKYSNSLSILFPNLESFSIVKSFEFVRVGKFKGERERAKTHVRIEEAA